MSGFPDPVFGIKVESDGDWRGDAMSFTCDGCRRLVIRTRPRGPGASIEESYLCRECTIEAAGLRDLIILAEAA